MNSENKKNNYIIYHLHSDLSNGTTNIDSVTKYEEYIQRAADSDMKALAFSEHGNIFEWHHKKEAVNKAGMKYIHACEMYITETLDEKIRDNYHCVLIAKNYDGVKELNQLTSLAYNRNDNHFYYVPRISIDELLKVSDNIIITTACLGSILNNGSVELKKKYLDFLIKNKTRCFLEIQHHNVEEQKKYNKYLWEISKRTGLLLIAGTDTHALNDEHLEGRAMLQKGKNVHFANEDNWDLSFKTYEELLEAYARQNSLPEDVYLKAIDNTNLLYNMVEDFTIDKNAKYPKLYANSTEQFKKEINNAYKKHPYISKRYSREEVLKEVTAELEVYDKTNTIDFMLLQTHLRNWERENGIFCGYGRGSVNGSFIAYLLNVTQMDSKKFGLNLFRFLNPDRVSLADIDTDYGDEDREKVKKFILKDHLGLDNIHSSEIITFNTIATKGAIKDIGRALKMPINEVQKISDTVVDNTAPDSVRRKYPELFKYVDIVVGTIVSVGSHPSGILITDTPIESDIGTCMLSGSKYPVSVLNMKELDDRMNVKLDVLGLTNMSIINNTCDMVGMDRITPDNIPLDDKEVWESIREDTTCIFQWESASSSAYLKDFMSDETLATAKEVDPNFSYMKWFSFGNGLIRPACASFRNEVAKGRFYDNGLEELNSFLAPTLGRVSMQEDIMQFLVKFCGYSGSEADTVRRGIAKKKGTEQLLPEIERRFIEYAPKHFNVTQEECAEVIKPFIQVILDASAYAFSWNHSMAYSCIGYVCGYLRYYHKGEFLTAALNAYEGKDEKTQNIIKYAQKNHIPIKTIKFRFSKSLYQYNNQTKAIYKGISSIKFLNKKIAEELYKLGQRQYESFIELLVDIDKETSVDSRQLDTLIKLDFFSEFGEINELLVIVRIFDAVHGRKVLVRANIPKFNICEDELLTIGASFTEKQVRDFDEYKLMELILNKIKIDKTNLIDKIKYQQELLGYIDIIVPKLDNKFAIVLSIAGKYKNKMVTLYRLNSGIQETVKVKGKTLESFKLSEGDLIQTLEAREEKKWFKDTDGNWGRKDEYETILYRWKHIDNL